jgi:hypothetical protein
MRKEETIKNRRDKNYEGLLTERLLQFIWQFQYFDLKDLKTIEGEPLEIIKPGQFNKNQGPDFLDAQVRIGSTILAGSVELHCKTSQWVDHGHSQDANYRNVILHVVFQNDMRTSPLLLPVLALENRISYWMTQKYNDLMLARSEIACAGSLQQVNDLVWIKWKERLVAERLQKRAMKIHSFLKENRSNWEETFWWMLARSFGSKVNSDAFEVLARSLPLGIISRHRKQIHQLEALLYGQANLLNQNFSEDYPKMLSREYQFLKKKYSLRPIQLPIHFLRMRPGNFPTLRLAQLAMLLHEKDVLFPHILELNNTNEIMNFLKISPNDYWLYHYVPDEPSGYKKKPLGRDTINNIIINTVVPFIFAYAGYYKNETLQSKAVNFLLELDPEENSISKQFTSLGLKNENAFASQAYLELKTCYCDQKKCLECAVGYQILRSDGLT